jgi:Xaa-Pro aminopeptidase
LRLFSGNEGVACVEDWLSQNLPSGARIGFDPQLMSEHVFNKYSDALETTGQVMVPVARNLVDAVWASERPTRPLNPLLVLSTKYSGEESLHSHSHMHARYCD